MTGTTPKTGGPGWGGQIHWQMLASMLLLYISGYVVGLLSTEGVNGKIAAIVIGGGLAVFALWWAPGAGEIARDWERDQA